MSGLPRPSRVFLLTLFGVFCALSPGYANVFTSDCEGWGTTFPNDPDFFGVHCVCATANLYLVTDGGDVLIETQQDCQAMDGTAQPLDLGGTWAATLASGTYKVTIGMNIFSDCDSVDPDHVNPDTRDPIPTFVCEGEETEEGLCWMTGGGVKFQATEGNGPSDSVGGNVFPGCSPDAGDGGSWNHIAHSLDLHFHGTSVSEVECGNVEGIEEGSESPVTPFNYIEFRGEGTLKGIGGNQDDFGDVHFFARVEDRNEPGSRGNDDEADVDRYFLHVFSDPSDPVGTTLLLVDVDGDASTVDPLSITGGNFQLHISSCDDPPNF